jgi:hypothetical protein
MQRDTLGWNEDAGFAFPIWSKSVVVVLSFSAGEDSTMGDGYDKALDMLQKTINGIGVAGVTKVEMLSALADLAVILGIIIEGEDDTYDLLEDMTTRVERFKQAGLGNDDLPPHPGEA